MLVLTRKTNQSIMIGDNVEISILSVAGDKVRLGIDAPRDVEVFRKEVFNSREAAAKAAAEGSPEDAAAPAATEAPPSESAGDEAATS